MILPAPFELPNSTPAGPLTAAEIAPWKLQVAASDRLTAVRGVNPLTGMDVSARFLVKSAADHGDPNSPNPRAEIYQGRNGGSAAAGDAGMIPVGQTFYHVLVFTPISGNRKTWQNHGQMHGAQSGKQPAWQCKTDYANVLCFQVNSPAGSKEWRVGPTPWGQTVTLVLKLRVDPTGNGLVGVKMRVGSDPEAPFSVVVPEWTGAIGFQDTYPKGIIYGDAGGSGFPWETLWHRARYCLATESEAMALTTLNAPIDPGPPPSTGPTQAQLDQAIADRDAARAIALDLKSRIDRMVSIGQTGA